MAINEWILGNLDLIKNFGDTRLCHGNPFNNWNNVSSMYGSIPDIINRDGKEIRGDFSIQKMGEIQEEKQQLYLPLEGTLLKWSKDDRRNSSELEKEHKE